MTSRISPKSTDDAAGRSALDLTKALVEIPSPGGSRGSISVLKAVTAWLDERGLPHRTLRLRGSPVALAVEVDSGRGGPALCLNACADTAPVGDRSAWSVPPFGGEVIDGWLYGRGSADSKAGISVFCHVLQHWLHRELPAGRLIACFDADEHTGRFKGFRTFVDRFSDVSAAMIGYPGQDAIRIGARGYWRAAITVYGVSQHSGSRCAPRNAIVKAAELVKELNSVARDNGNDEVQPQLTVTGIRGGAGYTMVPDRCAVSVDVRLTPQFDAERAEQEVLRSLERVDTRFSSERRSTLRRRFGWPAYELATDERVVESIAGAAHDILGREIPTKVAGPSNVGNLCAAYGIPATCGFGVGYKSIHAPDEAIEVGSLDHTIRVYTRAVERYLTPSGNDSNRL